MRYDKDRYITLLWRMLDDMMWIQSFHHSKDNASEINALYENYRNKIKDLLKETEKELEHERYINRKNNKGNDQ